VAGARAPGAAGADPTALGRRAAAPTLPLSVTYGAIVAGNAPLARLLLAAGANPNDGESLYHAVEGGDAEAVEALIAFGATARGTNALLRAIDRHDAAMLARLLAHDADPNEGAGEGQDGFLKGTRPALHHAALRNAPREIAAALLAAGADPRRTWEGRDAFGFARVHGAAGVVAALTEAGCARPLTPSEAVIAAWHEGAVGVAEVSAVAAGALAGSGALAPADAARAERWFLHRMAARADGASALQRALEAGCDPSATQDDGMTPLHAAAWEGYAPQVRVLLAWPHDLTHRNAYGGDALATLVHGAAHAVGPGRDHVACAEALLAAGAVVTPELLDEVVDAGLRAVLMAGMR
jgi:ankyrin repeat protein